MSCCDTPGTFVHNLFIFGPTHPFCKDKYPFNRFNVHVNADDCSSSNRISSSFDPSASQLLPAGAIDARTAILSAPARTMLSSLRANLSALRHAAGAHAFLVLWHPDAVEDPVLRIEAFASGANMVREC